jgi:hypothetical protein
MDFRIENAIGHRRDAVQDALLNPEFVRATADLPKIGDTELLELTRDATTARLRVRYRFTAPLSRAVTAVLDPEKMTWVDDGTFDLAAFRSRHVLLPDHYADRFQSQFDSELSDDGAGTKWTLDGTLDVRAPLVGGKVARVIVDGLRDAAVAQAALLDRWIAR